MLRDIRAKLKVMHFEKMFWTDSKVVLSYIQKESREFNVFVANRVQLIKDNSRGEQWKYNSANLKSIV